MTHPITDSIASALLALKSIDPSYRLDDATSKALADARIDWLVDDTSEQTMTMRAETTEGSYSILVRTRPGDCITVQCKTPLGLSTQVNANNEDSDPPWCNTEGLSGLLGRVQALCTLQLAWLKSHDRETDEIPGMLRLTY